MGLGAEARWLGELLFFAMPVSVFLVNLAILILAHERDWRPKWLAWVAFLVAMAIPGSVLMAGAASLQFFCCSFLGFV
jgi:hypothetical protein